MLYTRFESAILQYEHKSPFMSPTNTQTTAQLQKKLIFIDLSNSSHSIALCQRGKLV